jgi:hypothetical protein
MARRGGHTEEELPFVALMDTMTNVVGVLIIVLVLVGISLARAANKIISELPPVTVEEHAELKKKVEETTPKHDPDKVIEDTSKLEQELKKVTESLQTMDRTTDKQQIKLIDLDTLQKQLEEKRKDRDKHKTEVAKLLTDLDKLKQQLDTTPVFVPPPAMVVKLPNPRPMPDKAEIFRFLVAGGRVLFIDETGYTDLVEEELKRNDSMLAISHETVKGADGKPVMVRDKFGRTSQQRKTTYDPKKLTAHFIQRKLGNRDVKIEVTPSPNSGRIPVKIIPEPNAGESIEQTRTLISIFQTTLKKVKADPKGVVWFHVFKDSIETYLLARDVADQLGVPVGWDLTTSSFFSRTLPPDYAVTFTPGATPAPGTQPAVSIAPPKTTLD